MPDRKAAVFSAEDVAEVSAQVLSACRIHSASLGFNGECRVKSIAIIKDRKRLHQNFSLNELIHHRPPAKFSSMKLQLLQLHSAVLPDDRKPDRILAKFLSMELSPLQMQPAAECHDRDHAVTAGCSRPKKRMNG